MHLPTCAWVAALPEFGPERHGVLAAFADPAQKIVHVRVEQARARAVGQPRWEGVGGCVFAHGGSGQAHSAGDAEQRLSIGLPTPHLVVGGLPLLPALCACFALRRRAWEGAVSPGNKRCWSRNRWQTAEPRMSTMQPAFDSLAHVGEQVPPVGDLYGPGSTEAGTTGVLGRAVPSHDFDAGRCRSQPANVAAVRSGRRSTTRCRSRFTTMVP